MTVNEMIEAKARYAQLNSVAAVCAALGIIAAAAIFYAVVIHSRRKSFDSYVKTVRETAGLGCVVAAVSLIMGLVALGATWDYFTAYEKVRAEWAGYQILELRL